MVIHKFQQYNNNNNRKQKVHSKYNEASILNSEHAW